TTEDKLKECLQNYGNVKKLKLEKHRAIIQDQPQLGRDSSDDQQQQKSRETEILEAFVVFDPCPCPEDLVKLNNLDINGEPVYVHKINNSGLQATRLDFGYMSEPNAFAIAYTVGDQVAADINERSRKLLIMF